MIRQRHHSNVDTMEDIQPVAGEGQCDCACQQTGSELSVWLHVTDRCNLSCAYCYLPHEANDMSLETGYASIQSAFRSALLHGYKKIKIKYAGGEPLLFFSSIMKLHTHAQSLSFQHDLKLDGIVLSNGTLLTQKIVEEMKALRLRLMISMDGIGPYHECHRSQPNGSGSFESVVAAIETAR